jgi:hypothetical protein
MISSIDRLRMAIYRAPAGGLRGVARPLGCPRKIGSEVLRSRESP